MANILRRPPNWKAHWLEDKVWRGLAKPRKSAIASAIAAGRPTICFIGAGQLGNRFDYAQEARHLGWSVMEAPVNLLTLAICSDTARSRKREQVDAPLETGREAWRERGWQYGEKSVVGGPRKK